MLDFNNLQNYREDNRIEAKQALGGLPESIWETYSAFANAEGGIILLGVEELPDKSLHALDILDPQWLIEDFWAIINDPGQVSRNILTDQDVQIHTVDGKQIIAITVPKSEQMIYIGTDPYRGTYRRSGEGDYRCSRREVDQMLKKQQPEASGAQLGGLSDQRRQEIARYLERYLPRRDLPEECARPLGSEFHAEPRPMRCEAASPAPAKKRLPFSGSITLKELLKKTDAGFSETLLKLIDQTGKKDSEVYNRANISRQHFSKIRNNPHYRPTKATAIAFAIALELDLEQTKDLIGRAGYALSRSSKFDLIIQYFIEQGIYDLFQINEALYEFDQPLLGL